MKRSLRAAAVAIVTTAFLAGSAIAAAPVKVRDEAGIKEWAGSAIDGWSAWAANSKSHPRRFRVYVLADGGSVQRIPIDGTAALGDLIATGARAGRVVFQTELHRGDIRFYDPDTDTVLRAPRGINTAKTEEFPEADGAYLTFDRRSSGGSDTILYRYGSKTSTVIGHGMIAGQVNSDYAVYWTCSSSACDVRRYRISEKRFTTVPAAPSGRANYWPAVMPDGTVYYVQGSRKRCGRNTKILRFHAGTVTTVATVPDGTELASLESRTVNGVDQLLFTEITCSSSGTIRDTGLYSIAI